jgi:hypothetical protein
MTIKLCNAKTYPFDRLGQIIKLLNRHFVLILIIPLCIFPTTLLASAIAVMSVARLRRRFSGICHVAVGHGQEKVKRLREATIKGRYEVRRHDKDAEEPFRRGCVVVMIFTRSTYYLLFHQLYWRRTKIINHKSSILDDTY